MQSTRRHLIVHHLIRAAITLGFAVFIAYLVRGGYINLYIAPRMVFIVKLSAIALYVIGMYQIYAAYRQFFGKQAACDCDHTPTGPAWKHVAIYGLLALPLLLGFILPNVTMGTALAAKKGMNLSASSSGRISAPIAKRPAIDGEQTAAPVAAGDSPAAPRDQESAGKPSQQDQTVQPGELDQQAPQDGLEQGQGQEVRPDAVSLTAEELDELFQADMYTEDFAALAKRLYPQDVIEVKEELFMEILTSIDLFMEQFQGKTIEIAGFVYREPDMHQRQFVISRFAMDCCSADALPYGVLVEFDNAAKYTNDTWLKLRGTIGKTIYNDLEIMMIEPDAVQLIEAPESPYVYPNYDF